MGIIVLNINQTVDRGVVEFNAPSAKSMFVVRYFKRDHTVLAVSDPIEIYFGNQKFFFLEIKEKLLSPLVVCERLVFIQKTCFFFSDCAVPNCTDHGKCVKGECVCDDAWKGIDCSIGVFVCSD